MAEKMSIATILFGSKSRELDMEQEDMLDTQCLAPALAGILFDCRMRYGGHAGQSFSQTLI